MQGKTKLKTTLVVLLVLAGFTGVAGAIFSNGTMASSSGGIVEFDVATTLATNTFGAYHGMSSGDLILDDGDRFITLGSGSPDVVLITTYSGTLNENTLEAMNLTDIQAIDDALGLAGVQSHEQIYTENKALDFGAYSGNANYVTSQAGFDTFLMKTDSNPVDSLDDVVYVAVVRANQTGYSGSFTDYEAFVYSSGDTIYDFATV